MGNPLPSQGNSFPGRLSRISAWLGPWRARWAVIFVLLLVYGLLLVSTVQGSRLLLSRHFDRIVTEATRTDPTQAFPAVRASAWWKYGGVRAFPVVLAAQTGGPRGLQTARTFVQVSIPLVSPLMFGIGAFYLLLAATTLFLYERRRARREHARLEAAIADRQETAKRAERIEAELTEVRRRLVESIEEGLPAEEIRTLREEREVLQGKLNALAQRELELRAQAGQAQALEDERSALEELLEEALRDMEGKDEEIQSLESRLRRAAKAEPAPRRRREEDLLARRLRTLYKNLEIDDRAIHDMVALRDDSNKLRAEETLKRLADAADETIVRRKVAGLPAHLTVFELGFGGKGRIYYTRGRQRPFRILTIGAKNTQNADLEYLSRLPQEN
jgi:DNA repair exonuclease SbcCD ATPase subunit